MKKFLTAIALTVAFTLGPNLPAEAATWRSNECRFQTLDGRWGWTVDEVKATIHCAAVRFGIDESMARLVAEHESGFRAVTSYDSHCGVYQHKRDYWSGRLAATKTRWPRYGWYAGNCEDARSNIFAAFNLVKETGGWEAHWCRWTDYC